MTNFSKTGSLIATFFAFSTFIIPAHALTPLSETDMGQVTARDGTALTDNQLNEALLIPHLISVVEAAKTAIPLDAEVIVEGIQYKKGTEPAESGSEQGINKALGLIQSNVTGVDRIEFNNIRLTNSPASFGSVQVQDIQVQQQIRVTEHR